MYKYIQKWCCGVDLCSILLLNSGKSGKKWRFKSVIKYYGVLANI